MGVTLRTTSFTEPKNVSDVVAMEDHGMYSRDTGTLASGHGVQDIGMVLGTVTASGKYVPYDPTANDGSQTASAVLLHKADTTSADVTGAILLKRHSEAKANGLVWGAAVTTQAHRDAAIATLKALGVVVRASA